MPSLFDANWNTIYFEMNSLDQAMALSELRCDHLYW
ncbi:hypothetical protein M527_19225 [Sphingobium indicum IP26]|nr:hypothetical protein M527_19225 [Sphingobium indicum IP26]EQA97578.1 hypothetical protein L286_22465 [Sphingobium sp. HDIP04]